MIRSNEVETYRKIFNDWRSQKKMQTASLYCPPVSSDKRSTLQLKHGKRSEKRASVPSHPCEASNVWQVLFNARDFVFDGAVTSQTLWEEPETQWRWKANSKGNIKCKLERERAKMTAKRRWRYPDVAFYLSITVGRETEKRDFS